MNATQARQVLLVRACETADPPLAAWAVDDGAWAGQEALRVDGEGVESERWLVRRAELAAARLAQRLPAAAAWLTSPPAVGGGAAVLLIVLALLAGLAGTVAGPDRQIQLLAPPLLALLAWNLVVYALLAVRVFGARGAAGAPTDGPWRRTLAGLASRLGPGRVLLRTHAGVPEALQAFVLDWARASLPLQTARLATALHLAAAALAAGAVGGLYLRGIAFEFRAGWDSTFLSADSVAWLLHAVLGPAAALTGQSLPDAAQLEALRFSRGPGENAARWIHLHAITVAAVVLLPRGLLALASGWRAAQLQRRFPVALDDPYFQRLRQELAHARREGALPVAVLPYSYQVGADRLPALARLLSGELGPGLAPTLLPSLAMGDEDDLAASPLARCATGTVPVPLFAATATPEREVHGAFLRALRDREPAAASSGARLVLVDESGLRRRLAGPDLGQRIEQRRQAWRRLLDETGHRAVFIDLTP